MAGDKRTEYRVTWTVEVDADSFDEAARTALAMQRDPESIATVFEVKDLETSETQSVDLELGLGVGVEHERRCVVCGWLYVGLCSCRGEGA